MVLHGRIEQGAVILTDAIALPDGAEVTVIVQPVGEQPGSVRPQRVNLPLVASAHPGSRPLTAENVANILDDDDLPR